MTTKKECATCLYLEIRSAEGNICGECSEDYSNYYKFLGNVPDPPKTPEDAPESTQRPPGRSQVGGDHYRGQEAPQRAPKVPEEVTSCADCPHAGVPYSVCPCTTCGLPRYPPEGATPKAAPGRSQVGGTHYKGPEGFPDVAGFAVTHGMGFAEGNILKYVFRHMHKGETQDLLKALDYLLILAEEVYDTNLLELYALRNSGNKP